jgi:hypothetical protein
MSNYRRMKFCGGYYFLKVVSYKRRKILVGELASRVGYAKLILHTRNLIFSYLSSLFVILIRFILLASAEVMVNVRSS